MTTINTEAVAGTVAAPVDGRPQEAFNTFVVGRYGGTVTVILTSALETRPDGRASPSASLSLGFGTVVNRECQLMPSTQVRAQFGATPHLQGVFRSGTYCVRVSDVQDQVGPVAYTLMISHP
jgi:hypothetical protein